MSKLLKELSKSCSELIIASQDDNIEEIQLKTGHLIAVLFLVDEELFIEKDTAYLENVISSKIAQVRESIKGVNYE